MVCRPAWRGLPPDLKGADGARVSSLSGPVRIAPCHCAAVTTPPPASRWFKNTQRTKKPGSRGNPGLYPL